MWEFGCALSIAPAVVVMLCTLRIGNQGLILVPFLRLKSTHDHDAADYATYLKSIPAAHSECAARFALEPQQIAKQGLTDADRAVLAQPEHVQPHICRAEALLILEEYAAVEQALLLALSIDAECNHAKVWFCQHAVRTRRRLSARPKCYK